MYAKSAVPVNADSVWDGRFDKLADARFSTIPGSAPDDLRLTGIHFRLLTHIGRQNATRGWIKLSQTELAKRFDVKRGSINRAIGQLVKWKYIERLGQAKTGEALCQYRVVIDRPAQKEDVSPACDTPQEGDVSATGDTRVPPDATHVSRIRTPPEDPSLYASADIPTKPTKKGGRAKAHRTPKTTIDPDIEMGEAELSEALSRGFTERQAKVAWEKFRAHHAGKGSLMASWLQAWRTWLLREREYAGQRKPTSTRASLVGVDILANPK